jgi:hypothetical protein
MVNSRRKRLEREIDRDDRMTTSGFVHEVMTVTLGQLQRVSLANQCPDPVELFDEVDAITRKFRSFHRRLNDGRINRRGARDRHAAPPEELPPAVRPFAYHGVYLGAFASVEEFAHSRLDPARPEQWAGYVDLTHAGIDLHLSGRYWTVDADGVTHAFAVGAPGPGAEPPDLPPEEPDPTAPASDSSPASVPAIRKHLPRMRRARGGATWASPPPPSHAPERARRALRLARCDEPTVAELMIDYVARYVQLADHAWYFLRRTGIPGWILNHTDLEGMSSEWCAAGKLAWVSDPDGGVHVFALADPLASERDR